MHRLNQSRDRGTLAIRSARHANSYRTLSRRLRGFACAAALALSACAVPGPPTDPVAGPHARAALQAVNAARAEAGAPPMRLDPALIRAMIDTRGRQLGLGTARAALLDAGYAARRVYTGAVTSGAPVSATTAMAKAMEEASASDADLHVAPSAVDFGVARHSNGRSWTYVFAEPIEDLAVDVLDGLLAEVNAARARAGAPALRRSSLLDQAAQVHAADMAANSFLRHRGSDGRLASDRAAQAGYVWRSMAENLAETADATPRSVVDLWDGSPGHRLNMLNPVFQDAGLAVREAKTGDPNRPLRRWWVMVYGVRSGAG